MIGRRRFIEPRQPVSPSHTFSVCASSPWELGVGAPQQHAIGGAFERAFRL